MSIESSGTPLAEPVPPHHEAHEKNGHHTSAIQSMPLPGAPRPASPQGARGWLRLLGVPLAAAAACAATAFLVASLLVTHWYQSQATLYFPSAGNQGAADIIGQLTGSGTLAAPTDTTGSVPLLGGIVTAPRVASGPNTAITVLASGRCTGMVLRECRLAERWHLAPEDAAKRLVKNVAFGVDKNGLLDVSFTDPDPKTTALVVGGYVRALRRVAYQLSAEGSRNSLYFLQSRLIAVRSSLRGQQNKLVTLQESAGRTLPLSGASQKISDAYADMLAQRSAAQVQLSETNASIAYQDRAAHLTSQSSTDLSAQVPFAQEARERLRKAEADYYVARASLGPDNPALQALAVQVAQARADTRAEVRREVAAERQGIAPQVTTLYATQAGVQARRDALSQAMTRLQAQMVSLPSVQMQQARLVSEIGNSQQVVTVLENEVWRARIAEERNLPTFEVVDAAGVPREPVAPRVLYITMLAAVAGFFLVVAWRVGRAVMEQGPTAIGYAVAAPEGQRVS